MIRSIKRALCTAAVAGSLAAAPAVAHGDREPLQTKPGISIDRSKAPLLAAQPALADAWDTCNAGKPLVTSANDGSHRNGSWHYKSLAWDLRSRGLTADQIACLLKEVPKRLPSSVTGRYVFIFEPDSEKAVQHLHFHFDDGSAWTASSMNTAGALR